MCILGWECALVGRFTSVIMGCATCRYICVYLDKEHGLYYLNCVWWWKVFTCWSDCTRLRACRTWQSVILQILFSKRLQKSVPSSTPFHQSIVEELIHPSPVLFSFLPSFPVPHPSSHGFTSPSSVSERKSGGGINNPWWNMKRGEGGKQEECDSSREKREQGRRGGGGKTGDVRRREKEGEEWG